MGAGEDARTTAGLETGATVLRVVPILMVFPTTQRVASVPSTWGPGM
jgi:hypothetical protein